MDSKSAREAVAEARRNEDGTVTLHAIEGGGHVYPYPAETIHVKPSVASDLLQYEPAAYELDSHKREDTPPPRRAKKKTASRAPAPPPEAPETATQPEGPSEEDGSSDSTEDVS